MSRGYHRPNCGDWAWLFSIPMVNVEQIGSMGEYSTRFENLTRGKLIEISTQVMEPPDLVEHADHLNVDDHGFPPSSGS